MFLCWLGLGAGLPAQQYVFHMYRQAEGLKNVAINGLTRDRDGFLWIATENGVYRFLGGGFKQYGPEQGIAGLDVRELVADPDGTVWVGTDEDLYRWDGERFVAAGKVPIPMAGGGRLLAVEDKQALLVVESGRLYRLEHDDDGRMLSYVPVIPESAIASNPELGAVTSVSVLRAPVNGSRIWIGCGARLYSLADQGMSGRSGAGGKERGGVAVTAWGADKGVPADQWQTVVLGRRGTVWAAGTKHIAVMAAGASRFVDRSIPGSDQDSAFGRALLLEDGQGRMLATAGIGIGRWDGKRWRIIGAANGLGRTNSVMGMSFDGAGDLWLAIRGDGLGDWEGYGDWEGWSDQQGLPAASMWGMALTMPDRVYVATDRGPGWIDPASGAAGPLDGHEPRASEHLSAMGTNRDGSLWAVTHSGMILRIDAKSGRMERTAQVAGSVYAASWDTAGRVFFFTDKGIEMRDGDARAAPRGVPAANALFGATTIVQSGCGAPDGADWFVGDQKVVRFKGGEWSAPPIDGMSALKGTLLGVFCAGDGSIWVTGDQTGTWRLTPEQGRLKAWLLKLPEELRSLASLTVLQDRRGWIWLGTDQGLAVWNGLEWRHLTHETGLIWDDTNQGVMQEAADGSLWIGTSEGVSHLQHPERVFDAIPLRVSLTEIRRGTESFLGAKGITLPEAGPPLRFQISSPAMRNRSELMLKLRMAGANAEWLETQDGIAAFSRLRAGSYTFEAMACNASFNACSAPVKVGVRVLPPWWKTAWFQALGGLALLLVLVGAGRLNARRLRHKSIALEKLVAERTRELEESRELLRIQATHDGLTGLLNRGAILQLLAKEIERMQRKGTTLVAALVDLDHFKHVNDTRGHLAGDEALRHFAEAVKAHLRPYDHVGRYGGEEFLLVLTELPAEIVTERLTRLHGAITHLTVKPPEGEFTVDCSMGAAVASAAGGPVSVETLLAAADEALYEAKASGRDRVVIARRPVEGLREQGVGGIVDNFS